MIGAKYQMYSNNQNQVHYSKAIKQENSIKYDTEGVRRKN